MGDRSKSSAEMKVMKPLAPARNFVEENKRSELDFLTHSNPSNPSNPVIVKVWVLGLGRKAQMKLGEIPLLDLLEILLRKIREVSHYLSSNMIIDYLCTRCRSWCQDQKLE